MDAQPDFVEALLEPEGLLLLDLHNLLCQAESFGRDPAELLLRYPLERVREIHLAGGNHFRARSGGPPIRRDDHERIVPEACLELLDVALARCPGLAFVILEHADETLHTAPELEAFRTTFRRVRAMVAAAGAPAPAQRPAFRPPEDDGMDEAALDRTQVAFFDALASAGTPAELSAALSAPALEAWRAWTDGFDPRSVELGLELVSRWGERERPPGASVAAVLEAPGIVRLRERPLPEPRAGEVVLRVLACGVCGTDAHLVRGELPVPLPLVLGHETVGIVEARGEGVTLPLGARVGVPWAQASCGGCDHCALGHPRQCRRLSTWIDRGGGLALHARAVAAACVPVPDALSAIEAAPFFCAGHTVASAIAASGLRAGERAVVVGVGGLGHLAIQLASAAGAEVIAVTRTPSKARDAMRFGASAVVVDDAVRSVAASGGADVVLHTAAGAGDVGEWAEALRPEGRLVLCGLSSGPLSIPEGTLTERAARVIGAHGAERAELEDLLEAGARGDVRAAIELYPLGQLARALYRLEGDRVRYRAVVSME